MNSFYEHFHMHVLGKFRRADLRRLGERVYFSLGVIGAKRWCLTPGVSQIRLSQCMNLNDFISNDIDQISTGGVRSCNA